MNTAEFKDSPLGPIPQDWEVKRLGDLCEKIGSGATPLGGASSYCQTGIALIRSQNVVDTRFSFDGLAYINSDQADELSNVEVLSKDVLLNITGDSVARVCTVPDSALPARVNQHVCILRTIAKKCHCLYLAYRLVVEKKRLLAAAFGGGTRNALTKADVEAFTIPCPPLPEQQRIAEALGEVDKLIESLDAQIEKKRLIAKGVAHDLLSAKKRLPGFKGEWKSVRLGAIGELYGGLSGKTADDFGHGTARYITFLNVLNNVTIDKDMVGEVDVRFGEKQHVVRKGDLFFNVSSETPEEVAMCAALMEDMPNTYLNSFCCGFRLNKPDHNPLFISYYFKSNIGRDALRGIASGITRYNLSKKAFREKMLVWPEYSEQHAIAEVLSEMDASIAVLEEKREKYTRIKDGMMRDMLTGKVRLKGECDDK